LQLTVNPNNQPEATTLSQRTAYQLLLKKKERRIKIKLKRLYFFKNNTPLRFTYAYLHFFTYQHVDIIVDNLMFKLQRLYTNVNKLNLQVYHNSLTFYLRESNLLIF
jgi:Zn/Cd-binding protein ZinT